VFHTAFSANFVACLRDQAPDQQAMPDGLQERDYLAQADRHIAGREHRLANQIRVIEGMIQNGHNTSLAEECLLHLQQDLEQWRARPLMEQGMSLAKRQMALTAELVASVVRVVEDAGPSPDAVYLDSWD
jgi:hypothetical protein